jgi:hypothetical protein
MKTLFSSIILIAFTSFGLAQTPPAGTDIFVFDLKEKKGKISLSKGKNVTKRKGYDNQPAFFNNDYILYSSFDKDQNDIMIVDLYDNKITNLTNTKTSEYSPFPMERYNSFATVRVEEDGTQRLWLFPMDGKASPQLIFEKIAPVGYFAWNMDQVLMFVLGDPASLVLANPNDKEVLSGLVDGNARIEEIVPCGEDFMLEWPELEWDNTEESLLYIGALTWEANADGLIWFINCIVPLVLLLGEI